MFLFPNRITRYVLRELFTPTVLGLLVWTFFLMMNHFFVVAEKALSKNLGWALTGRLFLAGIPNLMVLAIPMAVLLGSLIAVGRLSADQELIAMQGAGASPWRLLRPLLIHGIGASLICFLIYGWVVPQSNYALRNLRGEIMFASNLASDLRPRVFYSNLPDIVLYVDDIQPGDRERLQGVLLVETDRETRSNDLILARSGDLYPDPDRSGDLILDLYDGVAHSYRAESPDNYRFGSFKSIQRRVDAASYLKALLAPADKVVQDFLPAELFEEMREANQELRRVDAATARGETRPSDILLARNRSDRATIEFHQRLALPLASFVFVLLALPLGVTRVRSGKGAGFALSLLVILVYWATFTFARDQALRDKLPAVLGPWVANLIILPWAAWGLLRLGRPPRDFRGPLHWLGHGISAIAALLRRGPRTQQDAPPLLDTGGESSEDAELTELAGTTTRFIGRLDQYIGMQFLRLLVFSVVATYMVYGLVESKRLVDGALKSEQPMSLILTYFKYFPPGVLQLVLPISCLVAAVITFTLLSRNGELTAIKALGISMRRATVSVVGLTVLLCMVLFLVQDRIAPAQNRKARAIEDRILGRALRTYGTAINGAWAFGPEGKRLYHARAYNPATLEFNALRVFELDRSEPRVLDHRYSEQARWIDGAWELENSWYRTFPRDGTEERLVVSESGLRVELEPPNYFAGPDRGALRGTGGQLPDQLSLAELDANIESLEKSGYDITRLRVAYFSKMAQSTTPLVMVLLGLPFAFRVGRRGSLYGVGVALILVLVYWATFAIFNALGLETLLDPWIAAWAPNILFSLLGIYLLLYVRT